MKKILAMVLALMLLVSMIGVAYATGTNPAGEPVCYQHGDVNADGEITGELVEG